MTETEHDRWDAIVIGSGIGGMTAAAALAKMDHKVLLLEQYKTLGGLTHSFSREGFSWDVGIHYLGCVAPGDRERGLIDWLTHTPMDFEPMGAVYDNLHLADAPPLALSRPGPMPTAPSAPHGPSEPVSKSPFSSSSGQLPGSVADAVGEGGGVGGVPAVCVLVGVEVGT